MKRLISTPFLVMMNQTFQLNKCYVKSTNPIRKQKAMLHNVIHKNLNNLTAIGRKEYQIGQKINMTSSFYRIHIRWFVSIQFCGGFGLWPFRSVAVPVCGLLGLWPFRFVAVSFCGRFSLWPFRFMAISVLAVLVCGRYDQKPVGNSLDPKRQQTIIWTSVD